MKHNPEFVLLVEQVMEELKMSDEDVPAVFDKLHENPSRYNSIYVDWLFHDPARDELTKERIKALLI